VRLFLEICARDAHPETLFNADSILGNQLAKMLANRNRSVQGVREVINRTSGAILFVGDVTAHSYLSSNLNSLTKRFVCQVANELLLRFAFAGSILATLVGAPV
jgi:hypothetical protein